MMLAHNHNPKKHIIGGWFMSEKLDGQRCFWDGGISRGVLKSEVPWANTGKDNRYKVPPVATGLWSRYGNVIHAPGWWLDLLPRVPLDGELYVGRGEGARQHLSTIIRKLEPDEDAWCEVDYCVFDMPALSTILGDGEIKIPNQHTVLNGAYEWALKRMDQLEYVPKSATRFRSTVKLIKKYVTGQVIRPVEQVQLPFSSAAAEDMVFEELDYLTSEGAEGIMLRHPDSVWSPHRSHQLVKLKKLLDAEAVVTGYTAGRKTTLGSKLLGKMGALVTEYSGKRLELSGFTDAERSFEDGDASRWAMAHPGEEVPETVENPHFPRGSKVTFRYRELSKDGIPIEARYWRKHVTV
jgi:DNA ligase-1